MFCKGYDAFTAVVKLPLAPHSQVGLYLKEQATSAILPRSRKPPQPAREEPCRTGITAEFRQVVVLFSEDRNFFSPGSALSPEERGSSRLVLLRVGG